MYTELIKARDLTLSRPSGASIAVDALSFTLERGGYMAILGKCGSGKSALAAALNASRPIVSGSLSVAGYDVRDEQRRRQLRKSCGVVHGDLDNAFVASYVFEEVAFAPRCFGMDEEKMTARVKNALAAVEMSAYERRAPQLLPAGQRARIAIAAQLAAEPELIVLDSVTEALTPTERGELLKILSRINKSGVGILLLSRCAEDAAGAERVLLISDGRKLAEGAAREVLSDEALMQKAGLEVPFAARVGRELMRANAWCGECPLTIEELVDTVCR